jgi:hypothetical protein
MDVESQDSQTSSFLDSAIAVGGILFEAGVVGVLLIPSGPVGIAVGLCFPIVFSYCGAKFDEEHFRVPEAKEALAERYAAKIVKHFQFSREEEMEVYGLDSVVDHMGYGNRSMNATRNWREAYKKGMLRYLDREALRAREETTNELQRITADYREKLTEVDRKYESAPSIELDLCGKSPEELAKEREFLQSKSEEERLILSKKAKDKLLKAREAEYALEGQILDDLLRALSELRELVANEDYGSDADPFDVQVA